jgi:outer membrane protein
MKKIILSITVLTGIAFASNAQTEKGKFILGGTASYTSTKSDADNAKASQNLALVPNVGYFVTNNIAVGTGIGYTYSKTPVASNFGQTEAILVSPFARHYTNLSDQFKFFGQLSVPLAFGTVKSVEADGDTGSKTGSSTSVGVALSPGFAYFPTKKVGIEFAFRGISYNNTTVKDNNDNDIKGAGREDFAIGTSFFTPQIGVQFYF